MRRLPPAPRRCSPPRELNPHVPAYLTGRKPLPHQLPNCIGFGDETGAIDYAATDFANGEQRFSVAAR